MIINTYTSSVKRKVTESEIQLVLLALHHLIIGLKVFFAVLPHRLFLLALNLIIIRARLLFFGRHHEVEVDVVVDVLETQILCLL